MYSEQCGEFISRYWELKVKRSSLTHRYRVRGKFNQSRGGHNGRGSFGRVGFGCGRGGGEAGNIGMMSHTGHVVHMRGLPHDATESDVKQFFAPLVPVSMWMEYGNGSLNGHWDVYFATHATAQEAMRKNGSLMGRKIHLLLIIKVISMKMFIFVF